MKCLKLRHIVVATVAVFAFSSVLWVYADAQEPGSAEPARPVHAEPADTDSMVSPTTAPSQANEDNSHASSADDALKAAVDSNERTPTYVTRDKARHPYETLSFFGIRPDMTVVELTPGAGWYTEILAPYLRDKGTYIGAVYDPDSDDPELRRYAKVFDQKIASKPELYDRATVTIFEPPSKLDFAQPDSVDMVLTFRNLHNWVSNGPEAMEQLFKSVYDRLKPGGVFGVVEHRLPEDKSTDDMASSGYLHESFVIDMIEKAGFKLDEKSEINANPRDTADHPHGVWALPPTFRNQDMGRERYEAIGESDRMTLRFVKPDIN